MKRREGSRAMTEETSRDERVYSLICNAINTIDEIDELISSQPEAMQKVDLEIGDWLHYIENNELNDTECVNVIKKIKELRKVRRALRKEHEIEKVYKDHSSRMMGNNTRGLLLAEINKTVRQLEGEYKNRVISEEDIKSVMEVKKKRVGRPRKNENNNEEEV